MCLYILGRSNFPSYFLGFSVYVSNTTNKDDGILYFRDTQYTIDTIPSSLKLNKCVLGRYVTYYNTREGDLSNREGYSPFAYLDLCEVQVHGKLALTFIVPTYNVLSLLLKSPGSWRRKQISYKQACGKNRLACSSTHFFLPSTITLTLMVCYALFYTPSVVCTTCVRVFFPQDVLLWDFMVKHVHSVVL